MARNCRNLWSLALIASVGIMVGCGDDGESPPIDAAVDPTPDAAAQADAAVDECENMPCVDTVAQIPLLNENKLDLLFVIDNSGSMREEQQSLVTNFSRLIDVLQNVEGGLPSLHIGVISTDLGAGPFNISQCNGSGDNGVMQNAPRGPVGCNAPTGQFIIDTANPDGTRTTNYTGTLSDTFHCIAELGTDGCGFEQPLESIRRALSGANTANDGFLRNDALLGVVLLSDEDDCSASDVGMFDTSQTTVDDPLGPLSSFRCFEFGVVCEPDTPRVPGARQNCQPRNNSQYMYDVQQFIDFVHSLKVSPNMISVAGIVGNPSPVVVGTNPGNNNPRLDPSCMSQAGEAAPGVRLNAFLDGFPGRSTVTTICNDDLSGALTQIGDLLGSQFGAQQCLDGDIHDVDPAAPGLQFECTVTEVAGDGTRTPLEVCDNLSDPDNSTNLPCHVIAEDAQACPATTGNLAITTHRVAGPIPLGTHILVECLVQ